MTLHAEPAPGFVLIPAAALRRGAARVRHALSIPHACPARPTARRETRSAMGVMERCGAGVVDAEISSPS